MRLVTAINNDTLAIATARERVIICQQHHQLGLFDFSLEPLGAEIILGSFCQEILDLIFVLNIRLIGVMLQNVTGAGTEGTGCKSLMTEIIGHNFIT